jgi:hypothetical protein
MEGMLLTVCLHGTRVVADRATLRPVKSGRADSSVQDPGPRDAIAVVRREICINTRRI